ncbi:MAG: 6-chlorohydroxyquinol-1,2-dioxygenase [Verrucomicrobia bacterium]|nr:6-chlorohydroxyquinol-1,2-dioxygenase [Verrucomicrobiota bacterium]MBV8486050.1 6-chlorohydroxyquinol-1,2-dioxygenase [Verrucomicrobiota bacterium]
MNPQDGAVHATTSTAEMITQSTLASFQNTKDPRTKELLLAAAKHLHAFATEVGFTTPELIRLAEILTTAGQISDSSRHEFLLMSDVMGLTMVVDYLTNKKPAGAHESSVLGPFYRADAPWTEMNGDISRQQNCGTPAHFSGRVLSLDAQPIAGAVLDVWQVAGNGLYENTDPDQCEFNLRGRLKTGASGEYSFWSVKPVPYPIPVDGPAGLILKAAGRHNMRPAHVHFIVSAEGYQTVISELFTSDDPYVEGDAVFGVKESLKIEYQLHESAEDEGKYGRPCPFYTATYDFVLVPGRTKQEIAFSAGRA